MSGSGPEDSAPESFPDVVAIPVGFKSHEGETEAVLSSDLSVATAPIASMTSEEGNDLINEADRDGVSMAFHGDRPRRSAAILPGSRDGRGSVAQGPNVTGGVNRDDAVWSAGEGGVPGQIAGRSEQDELVAGMRAGEGDGSIAAPSQFPKGGGCRREDQAEDGKQTRAGRHESKADQKSGSGLPSQMMKGRPSRSWSSARWSIPMAL